MGMAEPAVSVTVTAGSSGRIVFVNGVVAIGATRCATTGAPGEILLVHAPHLVQEDRQNLAGAFNVGLRGQPRRQRSSSRSSSETAGPSLFCKTTDNHVN
ncbi:hypothetical protein MTO96_031356 [Rhipicephalus appendiculatus]